jgi:peptide/nickel transport system substrate-binding protein
MRKVVRMAAVVAVLAIIAAACSGSGTPESSPSGSTGGAEIQAGGTLHLAMLSDVSAAFDPQKEYYQVSFEYFKCCMLRTLLATKPVPAEDGGNVLEPDLAADLPAVSDDGLTYTFTLKPGIHYAPPLQDVEVTAQDFIRAIEREADPKASSGGYAFYYSAIDGFDDFGAGDADSISGLSAPDDQTLVVNITEPAGDLPWRFAMPATAPIPPNPADPTARLGVAEGHTTNYGRFLVGTGPYMFEGSENLDFSVPAKGQDTVAGYVPGREIVLVRNPSYDPSTDTLRPAYVDRIEVTIGGDEADLFNKIDTGEVDYVADDATPPVNVLREYSTNPDKQPYLHVYQTNTVSYISMNLGVPPFDDIHVRKALNFAYDKSGGRQLGGGPLTGANAGHIFPDGLLDNKLKDYNPYATDGDNGDLELAQAEMAQSKYDSDGDGVCDDPVCQNVIALGVQQDPGPKVMALFVDNVKGLGIDIVPKLLDGPVIYSKCLSAPDKFPLCVQVGWAQDYPDAYTFGPPLFGSAALYPGCCNYSLLGATDKQLGEWGYSGITVPSVDDRMATCAATPVGDERNQCWADLDKYIMEEVVPWVPKTFANALDITSTRIVNYSFDYWGAEASFDSFAIANGGA